MSYGDDGSMTYVIVAVVIGVIFKALCWSFICYRINTRRTQTVLVVRERAPGENNIQRDMTMNPSDYIQRPPYSPPDGAMPAPPEYATPYSSPPSYDEAALNRDDTRIDVPDKEGLVLGNKSRM